MQVLDEYDSVQQQLEIEVSAHLACQQVSSRRRSRISIKMRIRSRRSRRSSRSSRSRSRRISLSRSWREVSGCQTTSCPPLKLQPPLKGDHKPDRI